jgi:hypothetical protein
MTAHNPPKGIMRKYMRKQLRGEPKHTKYVKTKEKR